MIDSPLDDFEHQEHSRHAAGHPVLAKVAMAIAVLAVLAAAVGSLETIESGAAIAAKNEAVLHQNRATDQWNFFEARSIKRNLYEIAAAADGPKADEYRQRAKGYADESAAIQARAKDLEQESERALAVGSMHEHRHHGLTLAATLLHVAIAVATVSIITGGLLWPWYLSLALGGVGSLVAVATYLGL